MLIASRRMIVRIIPIDGLRPRIPNMILIPTQQHLGDLSQQFPAQGRHKQLHAIRMAPQHDEALDRQPSSDGVGRQTRIQLLDERTHDALRRRGRPLIVDIADTLQDTIHDLVLKISVLNLFAEDVCVEEIDVGGGWIE